MYTLLRDLRRLRRQVGLPAPARGGSLALRHVDAGSCNGCEHELTVASNPYYDLQRYGLNVVASPRHADVLLVTGPVTTRMRDALMTAYSAMPEPRRVAALGDCALGCGIIGHPDEIIGSVEKLLPVDLRIAGCPPTPAQIAEALLGLLDGAR
jgi:Ni,Fe-hydrogenase III small subunit